MSEKDKDWVNPIDKDKITENPHNLPYAHNVSSAVIFPDDKDKIKNKAMMAMVDQTNRQMKQIHDQLELLVNQANELKERVMISEQIYGAEMGFKPLTGHTYHLYEQEDGKKVLSMIAPNEWGGRCKYDRFVATAKLLGDHTWDVIETEDDEDGGEVDHDISNNQ